MQYYKVPLKYMLINIITIILMNYSVTIHFYISEEIFKSDKAFWFSPSGRYLAYVTFNDSLVGEYKYPVYNTRFQYPYYQSVRYPKVGIFILLF